jgi:hypothetical protein
VNARRLLGKDAPIAGRDRGGFYDGIRAYRRPETGRAIRLVEEITQGIVAS